MTDPTPYIQLPGTAREALTFYAVPPIHMSCFGHTESPLFWTGGFFAPFFLVFGLVVSAPC